MTQRGTKLSKKDAQCPSSQPEEDTHFTQLTEHTQLRGHFKGLFKVWSHLDKGGWTHHSQFWLLEEPVVHGSRVRCQAQPYIHHRTLCEAGVIKLGQLVDVCGPALNDAEGLACRVGVTSTRTMEQLPRSWLYWLNTTKGGEQPVAWTRSLMSPSPFNPALSDLCQVEPVQPCPEWPDRQDVVPSIG